MKAVAAAATTPRPPAAPATAFYHTAGASIHVSNATFAAFTASHSSSSSVYSTARRTRDVKGAAHVRVVVADRRLRGEIYDG